MTKINVTPVFVHAAVKKEEKVDNILGSDLSVQADRTVPLYREIPHFIH